MRLNESTTATISRAAEIRRLRLVHQQKVVELQMIEARLRALGHTDPSHFIKWDDFVAGADLPLETR